LVSLWRAKWAILAVIVLAFVGGYQYSSDQAPTYTAQSRVVLSAAQPFDPLGTYSYNDPTRYVADQVAIINTDAILVPAAQQLATLGDTIDSNELSAAVTSEPSSTTSVLAIKATGSTADRAVARANAVATAYEAYAAAQIRAVADAAVAATTDPDVIEQIRAKAASFGDGVAVVEAAPPGAATSSLSPMRNALLITAVAALVAAGLALLWRRPPSDGSAVVTAARARVLGRVPVRAPRRGAVSPQDHAHALVALDYARRATPGPVLLANSTARSGAASVAYGLAVSAAAQGRRVLLVDADPDRRELVRVGASEPGRPLEELGRPGVSVDELMAPVPTPGGGELLVAKVGLDRSQLIDGPAVARALADLTPSFDLVLLQSGPVPTSPVAYALAEPASAVVVVARPQDAARSVVELRDRLEAAHKPLIGLVLTQRRVIGAARIQGQPAPHQQPLRQGQGTTSVLPPQPQQTEGRSKPPRDEQLSAPAH
jgi:Mrp family chromosome partitioning ATPase/capsular polysaccharide biosynthesis protein